MKAFNIYLAGVGGQGIGLLSEILLRGADHAGLKVKGRGHPRSSPERWGCGFTLKIG